MCWLQFNLFFWQILLKCQTILLTWLDREGFESQSGCGTKYLKTAVTFSDFWPPILMAEQLPYDTTGITSTD